MNILDGLLCGMLTFFYKLGFGKMWKKVEIWECKEYDNSYPTSVLTLISNLPCPYILITNDLQGQMWPPNIYMQIAL